VTTVGVVTLAAGRRTHLTRLAEGLARQRRAADRFVVVRMDDEPVDLPVDLPAGGAEVVDCRPGSDGRLPLAAARNAGARAAGTDVVVFLDVDCIPGADLVEAYGHHAAGVEGVVCGVVRYLPAGIPGPAGADWSETDLQVVSAPHPARPYPDPGSLPRRDCWPLVWTTSLAVRRALFDRLGGFDERFVGYGGEDTDLAERARRAGWGVWWSADAVAFHQHHDSESPPRRHLADIVTNARLFRRLHGWYPMGGWLERFAAEGLVRFDPDAGVLEEAPPPVDAVTSTPRAIVHPAVVLLGEASHGVVRLGESSAPALADTLGVAVPVVRGPAGEAGFDAVTRRLGELDEADLVHLHYTDRLFGATVEDGPPQLERLVRVLDRPTVLTLHDLPQPEQGRALFERRAEAYRRAAATVDAVVVSSEHERALAHAIGVGGDGADVRVVPLPVVPAASSGARPAGVPARGEGPPRIGILGFVYPGKGHDDAVAAMTGLAPEVELVILGRAADGHDDLVRTLERRAGRSGRRVRVTGHLPDTELAHWLDAVDVPLAPYRVVSASASLTTWLGAGRRPVVRSGPYVDEVARRLPGGLLVYRADLEGSLEAALADALAEPDLTRGTVPPGELCPGAVARALARVYVTALHRRDGR
jgi:N-acetylglucosaminyl-diphospho-decaprenol L-rhamnosyltransferase